MQQLLRCFVSAGLLSILALGLNASASEQAQCASWLDHDVPQLHSDKTIDLCEATAGKTVVLVNTASYCGYTKQFGGLEALHQAYKNKDLVVIGFPSNSFNQESDDQAKTASVCYENFGVSFLMTQPVDVKGEGAHPVFAHLAEKSRAPGWNFNKYLVSSTGEVVKHFPSRTKPQSTALTSEIDKLL